MESADALQFLAAMADAAPGTGQDHRTKVEAIQVLATELQLPVVAESSVADNLNQEN